MPRYYFNIPYDRRGIAKRAGCVWDEDWNKWYYDGETIPNDIKYFSHGTLDNAVSIGLYGGKSIFDKSRKFQPLIARPLTCAHAHECKLAQKGKCLSVTSLSFTSSCPHGKEGYIEQHRKDYKFPERIKAHPMYNKLDAPKELYFAILPGDLVYINLCEPHIAYDPDHKTEEKEKTSFFPRAVHRAKSAPDIVLDEYGFGNKNDAFIPQHLMTKELLREIVLITPRTLGYHIIESYQKKTVPRLLDDIRKWDPILFEEYQNAYGTIELPDATGRLALLATCKNGATWDTRHGNWTLEDNHFICHDYHESLPGIDGLRKIEHAYVSIPVTPDMTIKIQNNNQITADTEFV